MKTIVKIGYNDFTFSNKIIGIRQYDGFDIKCGSLEIIGILHNNEKHFLKLWGNGSNIFQDRGMDCCYSDGFHRLMIVGVDEI